jgi:hypothetical protein
MLSETKTKTKNSENFVVIYWNISPEKRKTKGKNQKSKLGMPATTLSSIPHSLFPRPMWNKPFMPHLVPHEFDANQYGIPVVLSCPHPKIFTEC